MLKNFFLVALRNTLRDKTYLVLNVMGLALGIAGSILILLYVQHELSYDRFHEKADRIYRIICYAKMEGKEMSAAITAPPQARAFKEDYPEIEDATRYYHTENQKVKYKNIVFHESKFFYADPNFLEIFNYPLEKGDPKTALQKPNTVILTSETAKKIFGNEDPLGKNIILNDEQVYEVSGIVKKIPINTHFKFDYLASFNSLELSKSDSWTSQMLETYLLLKKGQSWRKLEPKFEQAMDKYVLPQLETFMPLKVASYKEFESLGNIFRFSLEPLDNIHFNVTYLMGYDHGTNKINVYFFAVVAIFLLFIACINFMNLSTARFSYRSKEVGVKKVVGSTRAQLVRQFLSESVIITFAAMIISLTLVELILPSFNRFTGKDLSIGYAEHWYIIPVMILATLSLGLFAGIYPAFYLSSFKPAEILKSKFSGATNRIKLRPILVVIQFSITIILLIGTFVVYSQLKFIRNKNLGFNKENVLVVKNTTDLGDHAETFRQQVLKIPGVVNASRSWTFPGEGYYGTTFQLQGDSLLKMYHFEIIHGDYEFVPTLGIKILQGRNFSREYSTDDHALLINENAVKFLGLEEPLGTKFMSPNGRGGQDILEVIGIFEDVHYKSFHEKIEPMVIALRTEVSQYTLIKIKGNDMLRTIPQIEKTWKDFMPGQAMEYVFIDENLGNMYRTEVKAGRLFGIFSILAIFVACLGLLGLSTFIAEKRTKEVGIRKAHGASISVILLLLSREIIILITISSLIAWPLVYYFMHRWLQNFAYQTHIHAFIFILSSLIGLVIALGVVVYQSLRIARLNPVEALKYE